MSKVTTVIYTFAAITLLLGGLNELSVQLTLVGILAIILHTAITPADPFGMYPDFDSYSPTQPPLRDYVLVFGLASLVLVSLLSRTHHLLLSMIRATWEVLKVCLRSCGLAARQTCANLSRIFRSLGQSALNLCYIIADYDSLPILHIPQLHHSSLFPSLSHTFADQWTATTPTLTVGSPTQTTRVTGHRDMVGSSETVALKLRVSQLEAALEELRRRIDALTAGEQGKDAVSGIATTVVAKQSPIYSPAPLLNQNSTLLSATQLPSPSPTPIDQRSTPFTTFKSVGGTIDVRGNLRSVVEFMAEGTRQTDRLIFDMRNILTRINATDDTTFGTYKGEEITYPTPPTSRPVQSLSEHLRPSSITIPNSASPYPSPSPSPFTRLVQPLRAPINRRTRNAPPLPSPVSRICETAKGSPRTPRFNLTSNFLGLSGAPCSTPLRSAKEVERPAILSPQPFKRVGVGIRTQSASQETSKLTKIAPQCSTPRFTRDFITRLRERSVKSSYPPPPRIVTESPLDTRGKAKGKGKAVKVFEGMSDWIADCRRREVLLESHALNRNCPR